MNSSTGEDLGVFGRLFSGIAPAKILDFFIDHEGLTYSQSEVADGAALSNKTAFSTIKKLAELELLKLDRQIGQAKMYKLNLEGSKAAQLLSNTSLEIARIENNKIIKEQKNAYI